MTTTDRDDRIARAFERERARLAAFVRRRVANAQDAEDVLQDVFAALVEANRRLMPIEHVTAWLFRAARNRIVDGFRRKAPLRFADLASVDGDDERLGIEDVLPAASDGPDAMYARAALLDALEAAIADLPAAQRAVFVAHELEGRSFRELAEDTGTSINTLLSRKRYAVLRLRERLQQVHDDFTTE
jgi:RNA polymerase sigma factor (sigma-70 family)